MIKNWILLNLIMELNIALIVKESFLEVNALDVQMQLSEIHNCEKSEGKIVMISNDEFGNTICGYCGQRVDYKGYFKDIQKEMDSFLGGYNQQVKGGGKE